MTIVGMGPVAQLAPPPSPHISAAEIAAHFEQNATGILLGMFLVNIGVALSIALVAGISIQIRRIETSGALELSAIDPGTVT